MVSETAQFNPFDISSHCSLHHQHYFLCLVICAFTTLHGALDVVLLISDQNPTGSFWAYAKQLCCVMRIALQQGFSRVLAAGFLMSAEPRL